MSEQQQSAPVYEAVDTNFYAYVNLPNEVKVYCNENKNAFLVSDLLRTALKDDPTPEGALLAYSYFVVCLNMLETAHRYAVMEIQVGLAENHYKMIREARQKKHMSKAAYMKTLTDQDRKFLAAYPHKRVKFDRNQVDQFKSHCLIGKQLFHVKQEEKKDLFFSAPVTPIPPDDIETKMSTLSMAEAQQRYKGEQYVVFSAHVLYLNLHAIRTVINRLKAFPPTSHLIDVNAYNIAEAALCANWMYKPRPKLLPKPEPAPAPEPEPKPEHPGNPGVSIEVVDDA
jgi:hypothetical protein